MKTYIALIRGINVGGNRKVPMADLRKLFLDLGFRDVATLLQSGNVVFDAKPVAAARLEALLETEAASRLGLETQFLVRAADQWDSILAANPFPAAAKDDPSRLHVAFCKRPVTAEAVQALQRVIRGPERVAGSGDELFLHYPDGMGTSKLTGAVIEKAIGTTFTARNWNTVTKLQALASSR